jgi:hypothetical protein
MWFNDIKNIPLKLFCDGLITDRETMITDRETNTDASKSVLKIYQLDTKEIKVHLIYSNS